MQRHSVVVTGVGVISAIGNEYDQFTENLKNGVSGTSAMPEWEQYNAKSLVAAPIAIDEEKIQSANISRKLRNAMSTSALYCGVAAQDAVNSSGWCKETLSDSRTACLVSSGVADVGAIDHAATKYFSGSIRRVEPYIVLKSMSSTSSALITKQLGITGRSYSISSACATGTHNIGHAYELIRHGLIDRAICGGCEEVNRLIAGSFETLRMALSTKFNDQPQTASRPYDKSRDGFVIGGGAGVVTLETLESAQARGAKIYGEVLGYSANSDPYDLVLPRAAGGTFVKCIEQALDDADMAPDEIDAVNTHGTGTVMGDIAEINGLRKVYGSNMPMYSSTKSMTGHAIGAAGAIELIACLSMMEHEYMAPSINIEEIDPMFDDTPIVRKTKSGPINTMMSLNFGFGGTNAAIVVGRG